MVQISYLEVNSHSDSQKIARFSWNPKFHYSVHKSPQHIIIFQIKFKFRNTRNLRLPCYAFVFFLMPQTVRIRKSKVVPVLN
jgi:hypothetical protein